MSHPLQLPPHTQRSSTSQFSKESSTNKLLHITSRGTSLEDERRQDREVLKNTVIAILRRAVQSGLQEFDVYSAVTLLSQIAETAKPPLLPDLKNVKYAQKCIEENDELLDLLGECFQKESFSEIRSLEMLQPVLGIGALQPKIDEVMKSILPQIENFLKNPEIPKWNPPPFIKDPSILEFLRELQIPAYPNESPSLLYHNLHSCDDDVTEKIFGNSKHIFICNTSGSGKTRRILEGLTKYWGFYFVSVQDSNGVGVKDLEEALDDIGCYEDWVNDLNPFEVQVRYKISNSNIQISRREIQKVLASRVVVFESFLRLVIDRDGSLRPEHRRMWLLFQLSSRLPGPQTLHPFVQMKNCLDLASGGVLRELISGLCTIHSRHFPTSEFIMALDEAQHVAQLYRYPFISSSSPKIFRSVLQEIVEVFLRLSVKVIVSGTGLSLGEVEDTLLSSSVGKPSSRFETFVDLGMSNDPLKLDATFRQYMPPSFLESESGKYLQERIREYFLGRYRFLIPFVELLLANGLESPHRLLNQYIQKYALCPPGDSLSSESFIVKEDKLHIEPKLRGFDWEILRESPEGIQHETLMVVDQCAWQGLKGSSRK
ncbi:hypothetical protein BU17DRAFT_86519 [Hysterangium stoloniferum]|nr:hypothetical protein BU17DRAFT_86519 [Hysterangium stoloniferum]